jgi:hypothetical protein
MAQKLLGELTVELMQKNFTPGKMQRILGEEPSPEFYSRAFATYNVVVEEGLNTATQKQMQFRQLLDLKQLGVPVPSKTLLESSTLQNKDKLIEDIQAEEQQQAQMAQKQAEYEQRVQMATIKSLESKSMADQGLGLERVARIEENRALAEERMAEANNQRSMSVYHEIKAMKEIESIDVVQLHKLAQIVETIKNLSAPEESLAKTNANM